jgi:hypothetical protein
MNFYLAATVQQELVMEERLVAAAIIQGEIQVSQLLRGMLL